MDFKKFVTPKIAEFFLILSVVSTICSMSLVDLSATIFLGMALWLSHKENRLRQVFQKNGLEIPILLFFIAVVLSLIFAPDGIQAKNFLVLTKFKWVIFLYVISDFYRRYQLSIKDQLPTFCALLLIPAIYTIASFLNGTDFLTGRSTERAVGLVNSATYYAHGSALILSILGFSFLKSIEKFSKQNLALILLSFLLLGSSLYLTYTRGALAAFIIAGAIGTFFLSKKVVVALLILISMAGAILYNFDPMIQSRVENSLDIKNADLGRTGLFIAHFRIFQDHPITGFGYDLYKDNPTTISYTSAAGVPKYLEDSHAHNQWLQLLSSTGVLGAFAFLLIFAGIIFKVFIKKEFTQISKPALYAGLTCLLLLFLTDQTFEYAILRYLIVYLWALALVSNDRAHSNDDVYKA